MWVKRVVENVDIYIYIGKICQASTKFTTANHREILETLGTKRVPLHKFGQQEEGQQKALQRYIPAIF